MRKPFLLAVGLAAVYLCFLTASHYWDGVLFSLYIEKVTEGALPFPTLLHANHLLYSPLGYGVYQILHTLGVPIRSITVLQLINVFASVLCSMMIFRLCSHFLRSRELVWTCTLLFALGATWWKFSTDADSYVIAVWLSTWALTSVLVGKPRLVTAGICLSLAMLFHQLAVFGYVPTIVAMWLERGTTKERIRRIAAFALPTAACVAISYYIAYLATHSEESTQPFFRWITSVSNDTRTTRNLGQLVAANASSYLKLFGGGKLALIRDFFSPFVITGLLLCLVCTAAALGEAFRNRKVSLSNPVEPDRRMPRVLWASVGVYFAFLSWFEPGNAFYKLFIWPAIVLLIGSYLDQGGRRWIRSFTWAVLSLGAWNFAAFINPHSRVEADPVLALAKRIDRELPKSATVYYKALSPDDWYLEYFAPGRRWELLPAGNQIRKSSAESPVCFETTALPYVQAETDAALRWVLVNSQHNIRLECGKEIGN